MSEISSAGARSRIAPRRKLTTTGFPAVVTAALWMAAVRGLHFSNLRAGFGLMDGYWISFYLMNYSDGFRRRALMGSLFHLTQPGGVPVLLINLFAAVVLGALLAIFASSLVRVARRISPFGLCLGFAFCVSTLVCVYFEVFGDMLQICLVLLALTALVAFRQHSIAVRNILGYSLLVLCFFLHEASIFFVAPCLPFLIRRWPQWQDFVLPAAATSALLVFSMTLSDLHPHATSHLLILSHATVPFNLPIQTKPFRVLLREMYVVKFGGLQGGLRFAFKVVRLSLLALSGLVAMANLLPWSYLRRLVYAFAILSLFSVPLWVIAEDWGRFLAYNFLLAILVASWKNRYTPDTSPADSVLPIDALASSLRRFGGYSLVRLAALMILILSPFHESRVLGITSTSVALCLGLIVAAIAQLLGWLPDPVSATPSRPSVTTDI